MATDYVGVAFQIGFGAAAGVFVACLVAYFVGAMIGLFD